MTINNYGGTQNIFEAGSCPTFHIEHFGGDTAPQQVCLPQETTKDGGNSFDHAQSSEESRSSEAHRRKESSPICTNEAAGGIDKSTESTERHGNLCTYIIPNDIKPMEEIEKEMTAAARQNARTLAQYIKSAARLGYIDLRGDNGKQVYETLKAHFGFTFSYKTWIAYY